MNAYLIVKTLHILSSVLLVGTGFGSAFYLYFANRSNSVEALAIVSRLVVRADWWFTTPAVLFQPLSGLWLMHLAGWSWQEPWIVLAIALYIVAGLCWLPVVWIQIRMRDLAMAAATGGAKTVPAAFKRYARIWELLGYPAFLAMLAIYFLMVIKPAL